MIHTQDIMDEVVGAMSAAGVTNIKVTPIRNKRDRVTFKRGERSKGLSRVGAGTPPTDIKLNGNYIGYIGFNNSSPRYDGMDTGIKVYLRLVKESTDDSPAKWKWGKFAKNVVFNNEEDARAWVLCNFEKLRTSIYLEVRDI